MIAIPAGFGLLLLFAAAIAGGPDRQEEVIQPGDGYSCQIYSERFYRNPQQFVYLVHDELWGLRSRVLFERTFGKQRDEMACSWSDHGKSSVTVRVGAEAWEVKR